MPSFEIPDGPATVPIKGAMADGKPTRTGSVAYNVTNKATNGLAGRISVLVAGDAKAEWFKVEGEKERQFAAGESQTVTITIDVPPTAKPAVYKFRPRVVAVNDPDNDHTDGPVATMQVPPIPRGQAPATGGKGFPLWAIFAIIGGVVVVAAIVLAILFWPDGDDPNAMPDLVAANVKEDVAREQLAALDMKLEITSEPVVQPGAAAGLVVGQDPAPEAELTEGQKVVLKVAATETFPAPPVIGIDYREAVGQLRAQGFTAEPASGQKAGSAPDQVYEQNPAPGARMAKTTPIKLMYDPGVKVPDLADGTRTVAQAARDTNGSFVINVPSIKCVQRDPPGEDITGQDISPGKTVARMTSITVTVIGYQTASCRRRDLPYASWREEYMRMQPGVLDSLATVPQKK